MRIFVMVNILRARVIPDFNLLRLEFELSNQSHQNPRLDLVAQVGDWTRLGALACKMGSFLCSDSSILTFSISCVSHFEASPTIWGTSLTRAFSHL